LFWKRLLALHIWLQGSVSQQGVMPLQFAVTDHGWNSEKYPHRVTAKDESG